MLGPVSQVWVGAWQRRDVARMHRADQLPREGSRSTPVTIDPPNEDVPMGNFINARGGESF